MAPSVKILSDEMRRKFGLSKEMLKKVVVYSLNDTSDAMRDAVREEMQRVFKNPKPFIINGVRSYHAKVSGDRIEPASVFIIGTSAQTTLGVRGLRKVAPAHAMDAEVFGGERNYKGSEKALHHRMGQWTQWTPGQRAPLDAPLSAGGDVSGGWVRKVMSALQARMYEGANSTSRIKGTAGLRPKTAAQLESSLYNRNTLEATGERRYNVKNGRERLLQGLRGANQERVEKLLNSKQSNRLANFFIGNTRGRNDQRVVYQHEWEMVQRRVQKGRFGVEYTSTKYLKKVNIRPVLFLTKGQSYSKRLDFDSVTREAYVKNFEPILRRTAARWFVKANAPR